MAPYTRQGLHITVSHGPVSRPYIDMTVDVMAACGVATQRRGYTEFRVGGGQTYRAGAYAVEPDCSQAGYFWAAAALTGRCIRVAGIPAATRQGDVRFTHVLEQMGCRIERCDDAIAVHGGPLCGVEVDLGDMPDLVPTLAVVAAFARGTTAIHNVAHLKDKESDRLAAVTRELTRMGVEVRQTADGLVIRGGKAHGATIRTYDDHRIAMSFALAGLVIPGVVIEDEKCVAKSFPGFWDVFEGLYA